MQEAVYPYIYWLTGWLWLKVTHKTKPCFFILFLETPYLLILHATTTGKYWDLQVPAVQQQPLRLFIHMFTYYHKYQQGTRLRGITEGLIYRGTEMSRGHSGWGDLSWIALMGHAAQTRKQTACHWAPSRTDDIICHCVWMVWWLALFKPTVTDGGQGRVHVSFHVYQ